MLCDIIVIGGGASGLTAAISAKMCRPEASVTVCEKLDRVGRKILSTGNGRCNLSNRSVNTENYHGSVNAPAVIRDEPSADEFFSGLGIMLVADDAGRVYPYSGSAATVLSALRLKMSTLGITEECGFAVSAVDGVKDGYRLTSADGRTLSARRLIVAAGGYAAPSSGTDGAVMRLFRSRGYRTAKICPAVAPMKAFPEEIKGLKGVRAKCRLSAFSGEKLLRTEAGEIQFTENTLSGICVFNMAYLFAENEGSLTLCADFAPDISAARLSGYLSDVRKQRSGSSLEDFLTGLFGKNLAVYLTKRALRRPLTESISTLSDEDISSAAALIKNCRFRAAGASPWQNAQSTLGGITASEITPELASRREKGIYFCGEILDTAGDCGGYNLQWAWSSGWRAGRNCALSLKG
ncbi:MAG: aminoacetone oxidase family FAD-binding enzyme [Ruminococcus sp.]|nr:aminoacetone oxidase family FAD-binding enzyme [Ruminococcus sp.]